ncbi:MAG: mycofactocin biosynthesis chaperone MftB [Acidimicrobiia bacterium]|jgi:putative mycofactocin binding protein MftB
MAVTLDGAYELNQQVALRPEPFGALAYHYGNRRLVFLKSTAIVDLVKDLAGHDCLADALDAAGIAQPRWAAFVSALSSLEDSEVICAR